MKVSELIVPLLDYWVMKAAGENPGALKWLVGQENCHYSTDWSLAGPIIERENISLIQEIGMRPHWTYWTAAQVHETGEHWSEHNMQTGPTPLIAAMRCFVASKFGDEVPDEVKP
jgi:hypothetical protein